MAPKKAAKKQAGHKAAQDARRTFEHLGRVQALAPLTLAGSETLLFLSQAADSAFRAQHYKESADLLRAAEHFAFATLHSEAIENVTPDLRDAISEEFKHLSERMADHVSNQVQTRSLQQLRTRLHRDAKAALSRGSYRAALELMRGAEALAHVHQLESKGLPSSAAPRQLPS